MENRATLFWALTLCALTIGVHCEYHSKSLHFHRHHLKEKVTRLHFYLFDILSGNKPSAVQVGHPNVTIGQKSATPFGSLYAIDDALREGPEEDSKLIGNARGMYLSASQNELALVMYVDFGFTTGKFNGSSISVFSRNPITESEHRELSVVGGRGRFKMATGFAEVKTHYLNVTNGDAILEYNVTVFHY